MEISYLNFVRHGPPTRLNEENVEYVVLGGHAVIAHGYFRTTGVTFDECYQNRLVLDINGTAVSFINLRELIKNKRAVGRPQDLLDLENLRTPE